MFPGDSEGLQILEYCMILGSPSQTDLEHLSKIIDRNMINLISKCGTIKKQEISKLINKHEYSEQVANDVGDLIEKMIKWVPD